MKLILEQWMFLQDVAKLIVKADEFGFVLTAGEFWRPESQAWINALPADSQLLAIAPDSTRRQFGARVGGSGILKSKHCDRLAVDFNIFRKDNLTRLCQKAEMQPLADYWEGLSPQNKAGANFTTRIDAPHFERKVLSA